MTDIAQALRLKLESLNFRKPSLAASDRNGAPVSFDAAAALLSLTPVERDWLMAAVDRTAG